MNFFISNALSAANALEYFPSFLRYLENCSEEEIGYFNSSMFGNKLISEVLAKFSDERSTMLVLNLLAELVRGTNSTVVAQVALAHQDFVKFLVSDSNTHVNFKGKSSGYVKALLTLLKKISLYQGRNLDISKELFKKEFIDEILTVFCVSETGCRVIALECLSELFKSQDVEATVNLFLEETEEFIRCRENNFDVTVPNQLVNLLLSSLCFHNDSKELIANLDLLWVLLSLGRQANSRFLKRLRGRISEEERLLPIKEWVECDPNYQNFLNLVDHPNQTVSEFASIMDDEFFPREDE